MVLVAGDTQSSRSRPRARRENSRYTLRRRNTHSWQLPIGCPATLTDPCKLDHLQPTNHRCNACISGQKHKKINPLSAPLTSFSWYPSTPPAPLDPPSYLVDPQTKLFSSTHSSPSQSQYLLRLYLHTKLCGLAISLIK